MRTASVRSTQLPKPIRPVSPGRVRVSAVHWTLLELLGLVVAAAGAAQFAASGSPILGFWFLVFILSTRTAIVDYSMLGSIASGLVMISGVPLICCGVFLLLSD
jgi:hypothetical protein